MRFIDSNMQHLDLIIIHLNVNFTCSKLGLLKGKGLFFVNTIDSGYRLKLFLEQFHIRSAVLNAELPLRSRLNIIEQYNVGNFDYLIATDESTDAGHGQKKNGTEEEMSDEERPKKKSKSKRKKDSEYGVARGLDFRAVSFVVNVDFPSSPESYTHRVGRTARGGANGVAFSLVEEESVAQMDMLAQVQETQPPLPGSANKAADHLQTVAPTMQEDGEDNEHQGNATQMIPQPSPLDFDLKEIEGFRYRVEDVGRAVTKNLVRETRAAELKAEILNSQRLQNHFSENPSEVQLLRHDRQATHAAKVQPHLKHVPNYLLPRGMQVADMKRRKKRKRKGDRRGLRRTDNDPLQSYDGENVNLDSVADSNAEGLEEASGDDEFDDPLGTDEGGDNDQGDGNGRSTSGRAKWQQRHNRGKFSKRRKQSPGNTLGC
jgi:Superfamily II DNA and RNA helicases